MTVFKKAVSLEKPSFWQNVLLLTQKVLVCHFVITKLQKIIYGRNLSKNLNMLIKIYSLALSLKILPLTIVAESHIILYLVTVDLVPLTLRTRNVIWWRTVSGHVILLQRSNVISCYRKATHLTRCNSTKRTHSKKPQMGKHSAPTDTDSLIVMVCIF